MKMSNLLSRAAKLCLPVFRSAALVLCATQLVVQAGHANAQTVSARYAPDPITIRNDLGGDVGVRANRIAAMMANGQSVEIRGACYSACTMYLALPGTCISQSTRFGFHRPSFYGAPLAPDQFEFWSNIIADHYPPPLQSWYLKEARYSASLRMVSGAELIRLGVAECS